jgi:plastocyanin
MIVTGLLALVVMITAACQADRAADATSGQRRHRGGRHRLRFRPPAIQVVVGTEVTWRVEDDAILHNVTGDGFASKNQASSTWAHRFDRPGRVPLHVHRARGHGRSRRGDACAGGRLRRTTGACHSPQGERNGVSGREEGGKKWGPAMTIDNTATRLAITAGTYTVDPSRTGVRFAAKRCGVS